MQIKQLGIDKITGQKIETMITRLWRVALIVSWKPHTSNADRPSNMNTISERHFRSNDRCWRSKNYDVHHLI